PPALPAPGAPPAAPPPRTPPPPGARGNRPPAPPLLHQRGVVRPRLEPQKRQLEAVLAAGLAVAAARVAPQLGEDRHHLVAEVDRPVVLELLDGDRHANGPGAETGADFGTAVGERQDPAAAGDAGDFRVGDGV